MWAIVPALYREHLVGTSNFDVAIDRGCAPTANGTDIGGARRGRIGARGSSPRKRSMKLKNIAVKNFRLLHDVSLMLEAQTTVIVGRNNSGKTSLTEVMKRLLVEKSTWFRVEDFSFSAHQAFWDAFQAFAKGDGEPTVRSLLPTIEVQLTFEYGVDEPLDSLGEFIVDLDPTCTTALVVAKYALKDGKVDELFMGLPPFDEAATDESSALTRAALFDALRERIPTLFQLSCAAVDPNDPTNQKAVDVSAVRTLCASGFIGAHRGLDDSSSKERVVIGKVLENLFTTAKASSTDQESQDLAGQLEQAVKDIQEKVGDEFNTKLDALLPALSLFGGYPGLIDPKLRTKTTLDVTRLLTDHTKVQYTGQNGVHLPEVYNGLGTRNIILILLQLREFFKTYEAAEPRPGTQIVFIEEPEVHLHPQMQEVFIRKLGEIADVFGKEIGGTWPVQFVVSTHASHVANEAHFEAIRYFHSIANDLGAGRKTNIKDLRQGLSGKKDPDRTFLHQYMTLTRCDLFFADKAVLIEGTAERLLLPRMIKTIDKDSKVEQQLGSQYVSVIEIGGAYAHIFFDLLAFLEVSALVITDIDSVKKNANGKYESCRVGLGERTSNECIKSWFKQDVTPTELLATDEEAKVNARLRLAFQCPEEPGEPCGRSFEDAFMLANPKLFEFDGSTAADREAEALDAASKVKKSEFALRHALATDSWIVPKYIADGLRWLANTGVQSDSEVSDDAEKAA